MDGWARAPPSASHDEGFHLADECIHGFEDGLCAICFPPKEPEPKPVVAVKSRSSRAGGAPHRSAARPRSGCAAPLGRRGDRRRRRCASTTSRTSTTSRASWASGALLADAADPGAQPEVDIAAPAAREFRRSAELDGTGAVVADYVPFLLTTDAHVWNAVRTATPDPRLDPAAVERPPADYVIFVSSVGIALGARTDMVGDGRAQRRRRRGRRRSQRRPNGPRSSGCCSGIAPRRRRGRRSLRPSSSCARRCRSNACSLIAVGERAGARPRARGAQGVGLRTRSRCIRRGSSRRADRVGGVRVDGAAASGTARLLEQRALRLFDAARFESPSARWCPNTQ